MLALSRAMRVLSPRIAPPLRWEEGSTASTATLSPASTNWQPSVSIRLLLPAPGGPEKPMRKAAG